MSSEGSTIKRIFGSPTNLNTLTPFRQILHHIYYLPISVRKFILDWTRIQQPVWVNVSLKSQYISLNQLYPEISSQPSPITLHEISSLLDKIVHSRLQVSLISYFVKAETSYFVGEFVELFRESWVKEFSASQQADLGKKLDYRGLFPDYYYELYGFSVDMLSNPRMFTHDVGTIFGLI